ncbi:hypothetical protein [Fidelibacter multiformis]|uniref:hypothetical protein n=1 Tax=Fidelibacter multiformis TaxID=3377529 RepID=UPI0037DD155A
MIIQALLRSVQTPSAFKHLTTLGVQGIYWHFVPFNCFAALSIQTPSAFKHLTTFGVQGIKECFARFNCLFWGVE